MSIFGRKKKSSISMIEEEKLRILYSIQALDPGDPRRIELFNEYEQFCKADNSSKLKVDNSKIAKNRAGAVKAGIGIAAGAIGLAKTFGIEMPKVNMKSLKGILKKI